MEDKNNNLKLWDSVDSTDPKHTKKVTNSGRTYSSIDATSQYKKATEIFGAYGSTWGLKNIDVMHHTIGDTVLANMKAMFYYPGGEFETINSIKLAYKTNGYQGKEGYLKVDEEAYKKLETNTVTKALSRLGFNADVFLGQFEDNQYIQEINYAYADVPGAKISSDEVIEIQKLLKKTGTGLDSVLQNYQVSHLAQLNKQQFTDIKQKLGV